MELYFLRHGRSINAAEWSGEDESRPLTEEGKVAMVQEAATLARRGLTPDVVVTSPLARARQTAEIVAAGLQMGVPLEPDDRLRPGFGAKRMRKVLRDHPDAQRVMLVGHEPDFSAVIGKTTGARVELSKGALARVDLADDERRNGMLICLWQADDLSREAIAPPAGQSAPPRRPSRGTRQDKAA